MSEFPVGSEALLHVRIVEEPDVDGLCGVSNIDDDNDTWYASVAALRPFTPFPGEEPTEVGTTVWFGRDEGWILTAEADWMRFCGRVLGDTHTWLDLLDAHPGVTPTVGARPPLVAEEAVTE